MGGMFTVIKVRDHLGAEGELDAGWYASPKGTVARRVSTDPDFGAPPRRREPNAPAASKPLKPKQKQDMPAMPDMPGMKHDG
jgi:hypothetical protein